MQNYRSNRTEMVLFKEPQITMEMRYTAQEFPT